MKRLCNENERRVLYENRRMVLKGIYGASSKSGYSRILVGLAVSMVVMFAGLIPLIELFGGNEAVMWIWFAFSFSVPNIITRMIMNRISIKRKVKAFLNADNLAVNGATIVGINPAKGTILYIEDDFDNHDGRPVIIEYPALGSELNAEDIGKRLVVMYDSETSFQLMKLNESLGGLIPAYSSAYPLQGDINSYKIIPHPNACYLSYCNRGLNEREKAELAEAYVQMSQKGTTKALVICGIVIFLCVLLVSVIVGVTTDNLIPALLIGFAVCIGIIAFIALMRLIGKKNIDRAAQFEFIQEVLFHSNVVTNRGKYVEVSLNVYEWVDGSYQIVAYNQANMPKNTKYGEVLYKLTNVKGNVIFLRKSDIRG